MSSPLSNLPPGTLSPVMTRSMLDDGSRRESLIERLRRRASDLAVREAQKAADAAADAGQAALRVAASDPADSTAEEAVENASRAQRRAVLQARETELAAYYLNRLRRIRADQLPRRRHPRKPRPAVPGPAADPDPRS